MWYLEKEERRKDLQWVQSNNPADLSGVPLMVFDQAFVWVWWSQGRGEGGGFIYIPRAVYGCEASRTYTRELSFVGTVTAKMLGRERHFALLQPGILSQGKACSGVSQPVKASSIGIFHLWSAFNLLVSSVLGCVDGDFWYHFEFLQLFTRYDRDIIWAS